MQIKIIICRVDRCVTFCNQTHRYFFIRPNCHVENLVQSRQFFSKTETSVLSGRSFQNVHDSWALQIRYGRFIFSLTRKFRSLLGLLIYLKKKTKYLVTIDRVNSMTCLWNISFKMPRWCKRIHNTTSSDRNDKEKLMSNTYNGAKWQSASSHRNNPATVNSDRDWELSVSPR